MACQEKAVQQMTKRIIDINGDVIVEPEHYHSSLDYVQQMVDKMEEDGVDRSDMYVIICRLYQEMLFTLTMLKDRG